MFLVEARAASGDWSISASTAMSSTPGLRKVTNPMLPLTTPPERKPKLMVAGKFAGKKARRQWRSAVEGIGAAPRKAKGLGPCAPRRYTGGGPRGPPPGLLG